MPSLEYGVLIIAVRNIVLLQWSFDRQIGVACSLLKRSDAKIGDHGLREVH